MRTRVAPGIYDTLPAFERQRRSDDHVLRLVSTPEAESRLRLFCAVRAANIVTNGASKLTDPLITSNAICGSMLRCDGLSTDTVTLGSSCRASRSRCNSPTAGQPDSTPIDSLAVMGNQPAPLA